MMDRLNLMLSFGGIISAVYALAVRTTPRCGWLKGAEKLACGAIICFVCYSCLRPLGVTAPHTPFAAACAGLLGIPGAVFSAFLSLCP